MPIYEYECSKCGHTLEAIQKVTEDILVRCPACRKNTLRRKLSAPAFHLKGGGWYATDFKDKPKPEKTEAAKDKKPEVAGTEKSSPETKPDAGEKPGKDESAKKPESATPD